MLNALDIDTQLQEPNSVENSDLIAAEQNEQLMRNLCPDETRSFI
jgi:hypothetical protein